MKRTSSRRRPARSLAWSHARRPTFNPCSRPFARVRPSCARRTTTRWRPAPPAAHHGPITQIESIPLVRGTVLGGSILDKRTVHIADFQTQAAEFPITSEYARRLGFRTGLYVPFGSGGVFRSPPSLFLLAGWRRTDVARCPLRVRYRDLSGSDANMGLGGVCLESGELGLLPRAERIPVDAGRVICRPETTDGRFLCHTLVRL